MDVLNWVLLPEILCLIGEHLQAADDPGTNAAFFARTSKLLSTFLARLGPWLSVKKTMRLCVGHAAHVLSVTKRKHTKIYINTPVVSVRDHLPFWTGKEHFNLTSVERLQKMTPELSYIDFDFDSAHDARKMMLYLADAVARIAPAWLPVYYIVNAPLDEIARDIDALGKPTRVVTFHETELPHTTRTKPGVFISRGVNQRTIVKLVNETGCYGVAQLMYHR